MKVIDHSEYVRARVLLAIADDYEEVKEILIPLNRHTDTFVFMREEIKAALKSLLDLGWAKAYDLWVSQEPLDGIAAEDRFDDLYFWITPSGLEALYKFPKEWFPTWNED